MKRCACLSAFLVLLFGEIGESAAVTITYSDRATFEAQLGTFIVDDYSASGYTTGDISADIFSNAAMSGVLGETDYQSTLFADTNRVFINSAGNPLYCAGCDGSFLLGFTTTSVGDASGVFGVGFDYFNSALSPRAVAFVTFGNATTANFALPGGLDF